jgi:hypothetical protein
VLEQLLQQQQQQIAAQPADVMQASTTWGRLMPDVLIRAALADAEVPLHDPVRATARLRRWFTQRQQQQQQEEERERVALSAQNADQQLDRQAGQAEAALDIESGVLNGAVLLRVVPGGHTAFEGDVRESAVKLAFLLHSVGGSHTSML